jgi:putative ABC transport system permease protein
MGDMTKFIGWICVAVGLALLFVTASTMSMAIRERMRELAILKAVGFRLQELLGFILAESFGLAAAGALIGAGGAWLVCKHTKIAGIFMMMFAVPLIMWTGWMFYLRRYLAAILSLLIAPFLAMNGVYLFQNDTIFKLTQGFMLTLDVTPKILGIAAATAAALGIVACAAPAWAVARLSVVKGLKTLD